MGDDDVLSQANFFAGLSTALVFGDGIAGDEIPFFWFVGHRVIVELLKLSATVSKRCLLECRYNSERIGLAPNRAIVREYPVVKC